jgi:hypothetical protein
MHLLETKPPFTTSGCAAQRRISGNTERDFHAISATAKPVRRSFDTKMLFLDGSIEHGWTIHAKKLRRALRANSRAVLGYLVPLAAFFENETR